MPNWLGFFWGVLLCAPIVAPAGAQTTDRPGDVFVGVALSSQSHDTGSAQTGLSGYVGLRRRFNEHFGLGVDARHWRDLSSSVSRSHTMIGATASFYPILNRLYMKGTVGWARSHLGPPSQSVHSGLALAVAVGFEFLAGDSGPVIGSFVSAGVSEGPDFWGDVGITVSID